MENKFEFKKKKSKIFCILVTTVENKIMQTPFFIEDSHKNFRQIIKEGNWKGL